MDSDMRAVLLTLALWAVGSAFGGIKYIAHRGAGDLAMPEASLPAFSNAVATACDIVKLDVQETKDGVLVLCHDGTLKRYMGLDLRVRDLTYPELLEKGTFKPVGGYESEKIVTLDQALAIVKSIPEFWIDFKAYSPSIAEKALAAFARQGIDESRVMCATFSYAALEYLKKSHPKVRLVAHFSLKLQDGRYSTLLDRKSTFATKREAYSTILAAKENYGLFGVNMPVLNKDASRTEPEDVAYLKQHGLWVSLWFVQSRKVAEKYRSSGVDAFVTDHVSKVRF